MLYINWGDSDRVFMNFILSPQDTLLQFTFNNHLYRNVRIVDDYDYLFNTNYYLKGYRYVDMPAWATIWEFYAENFGPASYSYSQSIGPNYNLNRDIIMSIQNDSTGNPIYYSEHYKPEFSITPILFIDTTFFKLDFFVNHEFSHFFPPGYPHQGINFIDSVWMQRYYSDGDSIINISNLLTYNNPSYANSAYQVNFQLDTSLMKNGYNFYYKFLAKDKGIIPEFTWSPDTGFYKCEWNFPNTISEIENKPTYTLNQNFPNPFNPITTIEYSIAEAGMTEIEIMDMLGRKLKTLVSEFKHGGKYQVSFDASTFSSGVYFYRIKSGEFVRIRKMVLLK